MIISSNIEKYLTDIVIPVRLSCVSESGWPVILSLWYLFDEGALWCATQSTATVITHLKNEPRCAFEVAADLPPYCGIRGQGIASIDNNRGVEILQKLLIRYLGSTDVPLARQLLSKSSTEVAIKVTPNKIFKWNYTPRMQDSVSAKSTPCPD